MRDDLSFFVGVKYALCILALLAICIVMFAATCNGILAEQDLREYKQAHLAEYRQWLCDSMMNNYALEREGNQ